jgi:hypothetical protein
MTTVGQCDKNVHDQTNNTEETTTDGNTNVFTQRRTKVTTTSKTIMAVVRRALATQERGIDVGGVASCGAVATVAVGQINLFGVVQKILAHHGGVFSTQTSTGKCATFKGGVVVVAPGPPKFGLNTVPIDVSVARGTNGAFDAVPIGGDGGGVVEVLNIVAVGFCFII